MNDIFTIVEYDTTTFYNIKGNKRYFLYIWYKDKKPNLLKVEIPASCFNFLKKQGVETFTYQDFLDRRIKENDKEE